MLCPPPGETVETLGEVHAQTEEGTLSLVWSVISGCQASGLELVRVSLAKIEGVGLKD